MKCERCGRENMPGAKFCNDCGARLNIQMPEGQKSGAEKTAAALIIVLATVIVLLLAVVVGMLIYRGDGLFDTSTRIEETPEPVQTAAVSVTSAPASSEKAEMPSENVVPERTPKPTEKTDGYKERLAKKDGFLEEAEAIKRYSENYLDTAYVQSVINSESGIVYKKWDVLLNEVYKYLKTIMSESDFSVLQADETDWVAEKENAIAEADAEWGYGSGAPMARNMTAIQYTEERCYYLISLIN